MTLTPAFAPGVDRVVQPEVERGPTTSRGRSQGMDGIRELLEAARDRGLPTGNFRGLLHIAIGRTVTRPDGSVISKGLTWRELAALLKQLSFDRELVRQFGADPDTLAPRDRERFWYAAIAAARVDSREAVAEADRLVAPLRGLGYHIGPAPSALGGRAPAAPPSLPASEPKSKGKKKDEKPGKKKR